MRNARSTTSALPSPVGRPTAKSGEVNDEKLTFTALALMMCGAAWGAAIPQASRYDSRVQQVIYNPQNVTVVNTKPGFMTTLVFDNDEAVISAKPGFDEAWEATPDANRVNVRPVALTQGAPGEDGNTTQIVIPRTAGTGIPICWLSPVSACTTSS